MSMLETALAEAERGNYVFPLRPGTKLPFAGDWRKLATNSPFMVEILWSENPDANVALVPGLAGQVVLDIDTKDGKDGRGSLEALDPGLAQGLDLLACPGRVVRTPSGGFHVYFTTDTPLANTAGTLGEGLDTRCANGYVLAAGSVVDGERYEEVCDGPLPPAPAYLTRTAVREARAAAPDVELDAPVAVARATEFFSRAEAPEEGNGSDANAYRVFSHVRDMGVSEEKALELAEGWAEEGGYDADWVAQKAHNAYRYGQNDPGCDAPVDAAKVFAAVIAANDDAPAAPKKPNRFAAAAVTGDAIDRMPAPRWAYEELIEENSLNLIRGGYGTMKTFLALDLAMHASLGRGWAGHECNGALKTLYCAGEGAFGLRARTKVWAHANNGGAMPANFTLLPTIPLVGSEEDWGAFLEYAAETRPGIVFLDTVARAMVGLDEISTKDMGLFVHRCGQLQALGAAVVLIHHEGKDTGKGSRGSTALPAAADLELAVTREETAISVRTAKMKNAAEWDAPKLWRWAEVAVGADKSLVLSPVGAAPAPHRVEVRNNPESSEADFALAVEVQDVLKRAYEANPNARLRNANSLAAAIMGERHQSGRDPRDPSTNDFNAETAKLAALLYRRQTKITPALRPYFDELKGWGYWPLT